MFNLERWNEAKEEMMAIPGVLPPDGPFPSGEDAIDRYVLFYDFLALNRTQRFLQMNIRGRKALDIVKLFGVPLGALEKEFERVWRPKGYGPLAGVAASFQRTSGPGGGGRAARRRRLEEQTQGR